MRTTPVDPQHEILEINIPYCQNGVVPSDKRQLITLKLPRPIASRLKALARRSGKPQAQLIREGLAWRLDSEGKAAPGSVLDLAGDATGSLEGPADLATNRKHLRGFGR